ncbi:MarR family winged helix-turn-helix transcriptional regulator [Methanobacterium sp.]|uniref:MarR family winged helix-turn-helix transcriptional regulator n=1 Tax=Methanobacterium sp. TaxID=2164 RepID=UPI003C7292F5
MTYELELVEAVDRLTELMGNFQNQILSGDLKSFTLRQLYYIELINKHENISVSEIAKMLDVKKSTVSVAINQLIDRDIVTKIQSNNDKRFYFLQLTPKGEDIIKMHMQVHKNAIKKILNILDEEEVENFIKIVDKITASGL